MAQDSSHVLGHKVSTSDDQPRVRTKFTMLMMADIKHDISSGITISAYLGGSLGTRPTI